MKHMLAALGRQFMLHLLLTTVLLGGVIISLTTPVKLLFATTPLAANLVIYDDGLTTGWEDWSWASGIDPACTVQMHSGNYSIQVIYNAADAGLSLRTPAPVNTSGYNAVEFWVYGGTGGTQLSFYTQATDEGADSTMTEINAPADVWTRFRIPLSALGNPTNIARLNWQEATGAVQPTYHVDDIQLISASAVNQDLPDSTADSKVNSLDHPAGVAIAPNGRVFVVLFGNDNNPFRQGSVRSWPTSAAFRSGAAPDIILGQAGGIQVGNPEALAVDQQNRLYIADTNAHRVLVYNSVTTTGQQPDFVFGTQGNSILLENKFQFARGLALDSQNHLFVTDTFNDRILVYNLPIASNNPTPIAQFTGLNGPRAVAVDSDNNVYIADSQNGQVKVFQHPIAANNFNTPNRTIGDLHASDCSSTQGSTSSTYLACPIDLVLDSAGNLLVSDTPNNRTLGYQTGSSLPLMAYGQADFTGYLANRGGAAGDNTLNSPLGMSFDPQGNLYLADFENNRVLVFDVPVVPPTATPTATSAQPTATATATATTISAQPTATATATATTTPITQGAGDAYENDNTCAQAKAISADGMVQMHTIHAAGDSDWAVFNATQSARYLIEVQIPDGSAADAALEIYQSCDGALSEEQDYAFAPGVRLEFAAPATGPLFMKLADHDPNRGGPDVRYELSVRQLNTTAAPSALILVAGSLRPSDPVQPNIYHVTDAVYQLFLDQGYTGDRIQYLAADAKHNNVDEAATGASLKNAITTWAASKLSSNGVLTIYFMDHGDKEKIYLNKAQNEVASSEQINQWLTELETSLPGLKINIMIEACYSGSFVSLPDSLSKAGRLVMTSTSDGKLAWASSTGAHFSDYLIEALARKSSLYTSFQRAQSAAESYHPEQVAWLDGNGNGVPNEADDYAVAAQRGFDAAGTLGEVWPPFITETAGPASVTGGQGLLSARVSDDKLVKFVWAAIYPPNYVSPNNSEALVRDEDDLTVAKIKLDLRSDGTYSSLYTGFQLAGAYRVVFYAEDDEGLEAQPVTLRVNLGPQQIFLPFVVR
ncbi:MAG: SMP-30/gluconolactonase/LRE family protein [Chloroflexi bacterium]|nr:SMP-30/gluconolactonase/LRE family protein [Chloroflexota bacterium]